jgi:recombinase
VKIRKLPYGYCIKNGMIVIDNREVNIIREIFMLYNDGKSLSEIVKVLNQRKIEYISGLTEWNKSRVSRLLADERYIGKKSFPQIIDEKVFENTNKLLFSEREKCVYDPNNEIYKIPVPVLCSECASEMRRVVNCLREPHLKWYCKNRLCRHSIAITDEKLLNKLVGIIDELINNSELLLKLNGNKDYVGMPQFDFEELKNSGGRDKDVLYEKINDYISLLYSECNDVSGKTTKLKDMLMLMRKNNDMSLKNLYYLSDAIKLYSDGTVGVVLINGQEIRR